MEALNDRRQELDALLGGMNEALWPLTRSRIIMINHSACDMLGVDREWALKDHPG